MHQALCPTQSTCKLKPYWIKHQKEQRKIYQEYETGMTDSGTSRGDLWGMSLAAIPGYFSDYNSNRIGIGSLPPSIGASTASLLRASRGAIIRPRFPHMVADSRNKFGDRKGGL